MTEGEIRDLAERRFKRFARRRGSSGMSAWATANNVKRSRISEFMSGKRAPTTDILDALGLEWRIVRKRRRNND